MSSMGDSSTSPMWRVVVKVWPNAKPNICFRYLRMKTPSYFGKRLGSWGMQYANLEDQFGTLVLPLKLLIL